MVAAMWNLTPREARELQCSLAGMVRLAGKPEQVKLVAGADAAYSLEAERVFAAVAVLSFPDLRLVEKAEFSCRIEFPYVPSLLSFREAPAVIEAFLKLSSRPDVLLVDGQGYAHPRRLGLACHLGLILQVQTVGCAKSRLIGVHKSVGVKKGAWRWLNDRGERIGMVVRTRAKTRPLYVSPGHLVDFHGARKLVIDCCRSFRLPEPIRLAHMEANRARATCAAR